MKQIYHCLIIIPLNPTPSLRYPKVINYVDPADFGTGSEVLNLSSQCKCLQRNVSNNADGSWSWDCPSEADLWRKIHVSLKPRVNKLVSNRRLWQSISVTLSRALIAKVMMLICPWKPWGRMKNVCNLTKMKWITIINSCNASFYIFHVPWKCSHDSNHNVLIYLSSTW